MVMSAHTTVFLAAGTLRRQSADVRRVLMGLRPLRVGFTSRCLFVWA